MGADGTGIYFAEARRPLASVRTLGRAVIALLWVQVPLLAAEALLTLLLLATATRTDDGRFVATASTRSTSALLGMASVARLLVVVATAVVFIVWLWRATANLKRRPNPKLRHQPYWALLGSIVPIINLAAPIMLTADAWRGGGPTGTGGRDWKRIPLPPWFTLWGIGLLLSVLSGVATLGLPEGGLIQSVAIMAALFGMMRCVALVTEVQELPSFEPVARPNVATAPLPDLPPAEPRRASAPWLRV